MKTNMKTALIGIFFISTSWLMLKNLPDSEFLFIETQKLETLYGNSEKEIAKLENSYAKADVQEAKEWIRLHKLNSANTIDYIFEVTDLMRRFEQKELNPSKNYTGKVFTRVLESRDAGIHIDCGRFTDFISVFMHAEGIPFRRIDAHYIPDTAIGAHSFQEVYIKEKDQWAYVDLTNDKILMQHNTGDYVTVQDVYERVGKKDFSDIGIFSYSKRNTIPIAWKDNIVEEHKCFVPSIMLLYYTTPNVQKVYSGNNLTKRRYFFTDWITHFNPPVKRSNWKYYTRVLLLYTGILLVLIGIGSIVLRKIGS